jgi:presenilin-like A22 family membrane protease
MGLFADVSAEDTGLGAQLAAIAESLRSFLPSLVQLSNVAVIGLFVRAEVGRGIVAWSGNTMQESSGEDEETRRTLSQAILPASAALVGLAYFAPASIAWPIRNLVCSCLGIGVVRAVQIPKLTPIVAALMLLVVYDVYSVGMMLVELGSQSIASSGGETTPAIAGAVTPAATSTSTVASSAMGAVAMSKVNDSSLWQPGLLEVRLRGRVTDLLGLGDAVFPSLLSTFALRFDSSRFDDRNYPYYFAASVAGYGIGCGLCEFAPGIGSSGLPALLFIIPSMLTSVFGLSLIRGELGEIFQYKPMAEEETQKK